MTSILTYGRLVRFSHTVFALPFAVMAAFLAGRMAYGAGFAGRGAFWGQLALVGVCMTAARSAAMAFNRIMDRAYDAASPRNAGRPLVTGELSLAAAWRFYALCGGVFVLTCGAFWLIWQNPWPLALSVPVLAILSLYSLTKRFTKFCHLALGLADGLAPVCAWLAVSRGTFGWPAIVLGAVVAFWVAGFDIIYALPDVEVDRRLHLHSMPADLGVAGALLFSRNLHMLAVAALVVLWNLSGGLLGWPYLAGVAASAVVLAVEQRMVRQGDLSKVNAAFFTANAIVGCVLAIATIVNLLV